MTTTLKTDAFESYVISSTLPVLGVFCENNNVAEIQPLTTIDNLKKTIIVNVKAVGKTTIHVKTVKQNNKFTLLSKKDKVELSKKKGFEFYKLDLPPENIEVDGIELLRPPIIRGGK